MMTNNRRNDHPVAVEEDPISPLSLSLVEYPTQSYWAAADGSAASLLEEEEEEEEDEASSSSTQEEAEEFEPSRHENEETDDPSVPLHHHPKKDDHDTIIASSFESPPTTIPDDRRDDRRTTIAKNEENNNNNNKTTKSSPPQPSPPPRRRRRNHNSEPWEQGRPSQHLQRSRANFIASVRRHELQDALYFYQQLLAEHQALEEQPSPQREPPSDTTTTTHLSANINLPRPLPVRPHHLRALFYLALQRHDLLAAFHALQNYIWQCNLRRQWEQELKPSQHHYVVPPDKRRRDKHLPDFLFYPLDDFALEYGQFLNAMAQMGKPLPTVRRNGRVEHYYTSAYLAHVSRGGGGNASDESWPRLHALDPKRAQRIIQRVWHEIRFRFHKDHDRETMATKLLFSLLGQNGVPVLQHRCRHIYRYLDESQRDMEQTCQDQDLLRKRMRMLKRLIASATFYGRDHLPFDEIFCRYVGLALHPPFLSNDDDDDEEAFENDDDSKSDNAQVSKREMEALEWYTEHRLSPRMVLNVLSTQYPYAGISRTQDILVCIQKLIRADKQLRRRKHLLSPEQQEQLNLNSPNEYFHVDMVTLEGIAAMATQRGWHETTTLLWELMDDLNDQFVHDEANTGIEAALSCIHPSPAFYEDTILAFVKQGTAEYPSAFRCLAEMEQRYPEGLIADPNQSNDNDGARALIHGMSRHFRVNNYTAKTAMNTLMNQTLTNPIPDPFNPEPLERLPFDISITAANAVLSGLAERGLMGDIWKFKAWMDAQVQDESIPEEPPSFHGGFASSKSEERSTVNDGTSCPSIRVSANADTYSYILEGVGKALFTMLHDQNTTDSFREYAINRALGQAQDLLDEMEERNIIPSHHVVRQYVELLCTVGDIETANTMVLDYLQSTNDPTTWEGDSQIEMSSRSIYRVARANLESGNPEMAQEIGKYCSRHFIRFHSQVAAELQRQKSKHTQNHQYVAEDTKPDGY